MLRQHVSSRCSCPLNLPPIPFSHKALKRRCTDTLRKDRLLGHFLPLREIKVISPPKMGKQLDEHSCAELAGEQLDQDSYFASLSLDLDHSLPSKSLQHCFRRRVPGAHMKDHTQAQSSKYRRPVCVTTWQTISFFPREGFSFLPNPPSPTSPI